MLPQCVGFFPLVIYFSSHAPVGVHVSLGGSERLLFPIKYMNQN